MDYKCNIKVGSKVICVKNKKKTPFRHGAGWSDGRVFIVDRITYYGSESDDVAWPLEGGGVYLDCLSLANILPDELFTI